MQISCQFASDFFEKRLHYCTTIALQKSCYKPANRRAASDEKPTPDCHLIVDWIVGWNVNSDYWLECLLGCWLDCDWIVGCMGC